jgi:hypothetical protein
MFFANNYPPARRGKIVVWGFLASMPCGGMTWQVLHYLVGLRRLGFDVWYVEDSESLIYSPVTYWRITDYAANVKHLARFMESISLENRWIFRPPGVWDFSLGATDLDGLAKLYREADAVLNLCGAQELRAEHDAIRCLIYLQTDPTADQVRVANGDPEIIRELDAYGHLFSYGENLGTTDCLVPLERYSWQPTRPPVCVDWWETTSPPASGAALTTVANWKHTGNDVAWQGETWRWSKHHEFQRFINLPLQAALPLELAVGAIDDDDEARLRDRGWRIVPSRTLADPEAYREYIRSSLGELTVAKEQDVCPRTGWFSDSSVCYLAAGRPALFLRDHGRYPGCGRCHQHGL